MRVHVLSDLHLDRTSNRPWEPPATDADVVVLAGDIHDSIPEAVEWARSRFSVPVILVAGNHEFFGRSIRDDLKAATVPSDDRIHFIENSSTVIGGTRFIGATLWTDFALHGRDTIRQAFRSSLSIQEFQQIWFDDENGRRQFHPSDAAAMHAESRKAIAKLMAEPFDGPTVVVTHHAPHPGSVAALWDGHPVTPAFVSDLSDVILAGEPDLWIHGHTHTPFSYRVGRTRVLCNPMCGNSRFHPAFVLELGGKPDHVETLADLATGRVDWETAKREFRIIDEWPIRRDLTGIRPWTVIAERYGVGAEAIAAVYSRMSPATAIWPGDEPAEFYVRARAALDVLAFCEAAPDHDHGR